MLTKIMIIATSFLAIFATIGGLTILSGISIHFIDPHFSGQIIAIGFVIMLVAAAIYVLIKK